MDASRTPLAFLGTGLMGRPMAERLLAAGYPLTVWNRTPEHARPLVDGGARWVDEPHQALDDAAAAVLMLADDDAVRDSLMRDGRLPDLDGTTLIQCATLGPAASRALAAAAGRAGGRYLEAPVLGSTPQAGRGELLVLAGGDAELFAHWRPVLACFGAEPRHVGTVSQAATLKLAFNQLIAMLSAGFSLSLGMVRRSGLGVDDFMGILRQSPFYAAAFDAKLPNMTRRDFSATLFPTRLLLKDVDLVLAEAGELGLRTDAALGVRRLIEAALEAGHGDDDYSALYQAIDPPTGDGTGGGTGD